MEKKGKIDKVIKRIQGFFQDKAEVQAVYIYGSYASGKIRKGSDIDVAILMNHISDPLEKVRIKEAYIYGLSKNLRAEVNVVLLRDVGDILAEQILRRGKRIVEQDSFVVRSYVSLRIQQILDFYIILERMVGGMVRAIRECR